MDGQSGNKAGERMSIYTNFEKDPKVGDGCSFAGGDYSVARHTEVSNSKMCHVPNSEVDSVWALFRIIQCLHQTST